MSASNLFDTVRNHPLVRPQLAKRYERFFAKASDVHLFRGIFRTFDEAAASAPATKPIGYDQKETGGLYRNVMFSALPADYAALFWLQRVLPELRSLVDFGGHVGIKRYAFDKYLKFPMDFEWVVSDVAAVIEAGKTLAQEQGMQSLKFVSSLVDCPNVDMFFASGSLQYLEPTMTDLLSQMKQMPRHILLNGTPCSDGETFYTLNNIGMAFCPYKIQNKAALLRELGKLGYTLHDEWTNPGKGCPIPHAGSVPTIDYCGFYLTKS